AGQHAGVVPSARFQDRVLKIHIHGFLLDHDGGDRLECDTEVNGLPVRDAALDAAGTVRGSVNLPALRAKRIVVLRAGQQDGVEARTDVETFRGGQTQ